MTARGRCIYSATPTCYCRINSLICWCKLGIEHSLPHMADLGTVHLKSGRGGRRFEGRVIKFLTSFLGSFKIYNTCLGGCEFSNIKLIGFVLPNILHYNSSQPPPYFLSMEVIITFQGCILDRSMADDCL